MSQSTLHMLMPHTTRILVVDDSKMMMDEMTKILSTLGLINIAKAENGEDAWRILERKNTVLEKPIEIILCDWNMPKFTGAQLLEKVRESEQYHTTIFIMVTTENTIEKIKHAIALGVSNYILKPYNLDGVSQKLNACWKKKQGY